MILALILLHLLDGAQVWIQSEQITLIREPTDQCQETHGAVVRVGSQSLCVLESPADILAKLEAIHEPAPEGHTFNYPYPSSPFPWYNGLTYNSSRSHRGIRRVITKQ